MREIKFRGRDIVNGRWIYGNLEVPLAIRNGSRHYIWGYSYGQYQKHEADPKTVGEFTGLKDKYDNEIYEGDFIEIQMAHDVETFEVYYNPERARFSLRDANNDGWGFDNSNDMRIVGNIYENPGLLTH